MLLAVVFGISILFANPPAKKRVLVYTKNGKGYVHKNIPASIDALKKMGEEKHWLVDVSDNPAVMTNENLAQYDCLIFSNTNNEIFDTDEQRQAFAAYIHRGGAFVGIHSTSGSERAWPWFTAMVGGAFKKHPAFQSFEIKVINKNHPSTAMFSEIWTKEDECYYMDELNPDIEVLLAADLRTVKDDTKATYPGRIFGDYFPLAWCHEFEGARVFYTALGHDSKDYSNPDYLAHLEGGILWALGGNSKELHSKKKSKK